jgi:phenylacetate-coenzyme A ligase PaaK-like adenylate-forming protein
VTWPAFRDAIQREIRARMPDHVARLGWSRERIAQHQRAGLRSLVAHAIEASPFHARRLAGVDADLLELEDLARLPVMTKAEMMADFDAVTTDRRITRAGVEASVAETRDEPVVVLDRYAALATGGSAGPRGTFVYDAVGFADFVSSFLRCGVARGGPGQPRGVFVAAPCAIHATGFACALTSVGATPVRLTAVPATLRLDEIVERLNALAPDQLFGYPSMIARLADEQRAGRLRIAPRTIHPTGEMLSAAHRGAIADGFGVPVIDSYGTTEGLVGITPPDDAVHVFNTDICIVELVDDAGQPAEQSSRVLITNLSNHVQPLIRYEIADCFARRPGDGHLRASVQGRADDLLHLGDAIVHPLVVRSVMVKTPSVDDYAVRCTGSQLRVSVVGRDVDGDRLARGLCDGLRAAGAQADVIVEQIAELPRDARTGKIRRFQP